MSRSVQHSPHFHWAGGSNKKDKQEANRRFRRITRSYLDQDKEEELPVDPKEISDNWDFCKEGSS